MASISAIVPTYNRSAFLRESVEALILQTRPLDEIIIWDDGSSDDTKSVAQNLVAQNAALEIRYFQAENRGKSSALNAALREAVGDYIWICDDDDIARPEAAETLFSAIDGSDYGLVGGRHIRFSIGHETSEKIRSDTGYWPDLSSGSIARHMLEDIFFFQHSCLVRKTCYDAVGPFNESLKRSIDYDMFVRLLTRFPAKVLDDVMFEQRKHEGDRGPEGSRHSARDAEAVWQKWDRQIFQGLHTTLPRSFYDAMFEADDPTLVSRAGLFQRACVSARHMDWQAALTDFEAGCRLIPDQALTQTEIAIATRAMAGKHGARQAFSGPLKAQVLSLKSIGVSGQALVAALGRASVWRARAALQERDFCEALRIAAFYMKCARNSKNAISYANLSERDTLPDAAFQW